MPHEDKKRKCWTGVVKRVLQGPEFKHLKHLPLWTPHGIKENAFQYRKTQTGFKLKRDAARWEKDHWSEVLTRDVYPNPSLTFSAASIEYLDLRKDRFKGRETLNYKKRLIKNLLLFWDEDPTLPINPIQIENYLAHVYEKKGGKSANRDLRELKTLFSWMESRKLIDDNPITPIDEYAEDEFKKYVPPVEDIKLVIQAARSWEKDIIRTAYHTLARSIELRRLKCSDCDFINRKVWFYTRKRKGGALDGGSVDMNNSLYEILKRRCQLSESEYVFPAPGGGRLPKTTLDKVLPRVFKRLNFEKVTVDTIKGAREKWMPKDSQITPFGFHAIRHHVAAHLFLNCGYSVAEMQKVLRHKRASTTDTYLKSIVDMDTTRGLNALDNFESKPIEETQENVLVKYPEK